MKLYMIRHGQSEANLNQTFSGQSLTVDLTEKGEEEAKRAGELLKGLTFDKVYSSDQLRAKRTCEIALPQYKAEQLAMIREFDVGSLTGKSLINCDEQVRKHRFLHDYTPYGGENREMVRRRAKRFLDHLASLPYSRVAAFSHVGFMKNVLEAAWGMEIDLDLYGCSNCGICVFEYKDHKWTLLHWNVAPFKNLDIAEA